MYNETLYEKDITIMKLLGTDNNKIIKLITMNALKKPQENLLEENQENKNKLNKKNTVNDEKLSNNITRAKTKIFELAFCNKWDYFITLTIDPRKYNREDLQKYYKDLSQFIRDCRKKYKCDIEYLLIPELHKDNKSWHLHGLVKGIPLSKLKQFEVGDKMSKGISEKVKNEEEVYNWLEYQNKFGFCDLEPIKSEEAVSKYITKYITKDLKSTVDEIGAHLYYRSNNLKTSITIKKGILLKTIEPSYIGEYCKITELAFTQELFDEIKDNIVPNCYFKE